MRSTSVSTGRDSRGGGRLPGAGFRGTAALHHCGAAAGDLVGAGPAIARGVGGAVGPRVLPSWQDRASAHDASGCSRPALADGRDRYHSLAATVPGSLISTVSEMMSSCRCATSTPRAWFHSTPKHRDPPCPPGRGLARCAVHADGTVSFPPTRPVRQRGSVSPSSSELLSFILTGSPQPGSFRASTRCAGA